MFRPVLASEFSSVRIAWTSHWRRSSLEVLLLWMQHYHLLLLYREAAFNVFGQPILGSIEDDTVNDIELDFGFETFTDGSAFSGNFTVFSFISLLFRRKSIQKWSRLRRRTIKGCIISNHMTCSDRHSWREYFPAVIQCLDVSIQLNSERAYYFTRFNGNSGGKGKKLSCGS